MKYKKIFLVFVILVIVILLVFFINANKEKKETNTEKKETNNIMKIKIENADGEEQNVVVDKPEDVETIKEQLRELGYID